MQPEEKPVQETGPQENDKFPEWLGQLPSIDAVESAAGSDDEFGTHPQADADTPKTQRELVDWFSQLESGGKSPGGMEVGADEIAPGKTSKPATGADEIPVGDAEGSGEIKAGEKETGKPYTAAEAEIPDWLSSLGAGEKSEERSEPEISPGGAGQAELPAWVQALRPVETLLPGSDMPEPEENRKTETLGPLAGLAGVLPNVTAGGTAHKPPVLQAKLQISSNQQKYASQLEKMIQEEGQAKPRKPQGINPSRVLRWILSIILIGAVLLPLLSGGTYTPEMGLFPQEWGETNQLLREIPGRSTLLVVLDYDPALAGELEAAAAPVIKNLLSRDAHLVLISTTPVGPALGERLLVASQPVSSPAAKAYTNLGYLAGGQAGIQFLASDPRKAVQATTDGGPAWDTPALAGIQRLSDFGALIILTDNADTGRAWIEQTSSAIGDTPLLMIISAQAEPLIRPYFDSGQVGGLITGLMGGKTYEQTYATPGTARRYWDAFGSGLMAAVILVAAGSLWSAGKSLNNRRKAGTEK